MSSQMTFAVVAAFGFIFCDVLLGEGRALAQSNASVSGPAAGNLYLRAGAGIILPSDLQQDINYSPSAVVAIVPDTLSTDFGAGAQAAIAVGFDYPSGTRTELEYRFARPSIDGVVGSVEQSELDFTTSVPASATTSAQFLMANIFFDFNEKGRFQPFIGTGVGGAFVSNGRGESDSAFAYQARAGVAAEIGDDLFFDVEYVYTRTRDLVFGPKDFADSDELVRIDGDAFAASSVMASVRKRF